MQVMEAIPRDKTVPIYCANGFDFSSLLQISTPLEPDGPQEDGWWGLDNPDGLDVGGEPCVEQAEEEGLAGNKGLQLPGATGGPAPQSCPSLAAGPASGTRPSSAKKGTARTARSNAARARKRAAEMDRRGHLPRRGVIKKYVEPAVPVETPLVSAGLPAARGGYSATYAKPKAGDKKLWSVQALLREGLGPIHWNGYDTMPLLDDGRRVVAVLIGQPRDEGYQRAAAGAYGAIAREGKSAVFRKEEKNHRRGRFPAINVGVTYGKGSTKPVALNNHEHLPMVARLLADDGIRRLALFGSANFQLWAPNVFEHYKERLDSLWKRMPHLQRTFPRSVFPAAAFNFGPNAWSYRHRDHLNCPFGWCAIHALGSFDATKGGHLILWELKKFIEFPSGALVLIPSATITHSNVPVQTGDSRASFTQYCAGGLLRYVDNGFRTESELEREDAEGFEKMCALKKTRWKMGLDLFSKYEDIVESAV